MRLGRRSGSAGITRIGGTNRVFVVVWTDGGGRVLGVGLDNEAGGVACWLNGTRGD